MDAAAKLTEILETEKKRVMESFPAELPRRLALIWLARSLDWFFLSSHASQQRIDISDREKEEIDELSGLYAFGWNVALSLFFDQSTEDWGAPLVESKPESQTWADSCLQHCGRIGLLQLLLDQARSGLWEISTDDGLVFRASFGVQKPGIEYLERQEFEWLGKFISNAQIGFHGELEQAWPRVQQLLEINVRPWREQFIAYDATPELDLFYERLGVLTGQLMSGQDTFPGSAIFGGLEFNLYRSVVTVLIGWALKHKDFSWTLLKQHPEIDPLNIFTIFYRQDDLANALAAYLEISPVQAWQVLQTLILDSSNVAYHCSVPGQPPPPLIRIGRDHVLESVWGRLSAPFHFLVRELKRRYESDYYQAVNLREDVFRSELYALFPQEQIKKSTKNVVLKEEGIVLTDIDALLFDTRCGTLAIFQLKWQDAFGRSMEERSSKKRNLYKNANEWISRTLLWLSTNNAQALVKRAWPELGPAPVTNVLVFILGRNSVHFSDEVPNDRAAWGVWPQVMRIISENRDSATPLDDLHRKLKNTSPFLKRAPLPKEEIRIGKCSVVFDTGPYTDSETATNLSSQVDDQRPK